MTTTDPAINAWSNDNLSDTALEETTHGSGTTAQRDAVSTWEAGRPFWDVDVGAWFKNSHASAPSSVTWTSITNTIIVKASNESKTTTTFTDDADFTFSVAANTNYRFRLAVYFSAMAQQTKVQWTLPAGATVRYFEQDPNSSIGYITSTTTTVIGGGVKHYIFEGVIQVAGTAGTATLQWALDSGSGTNTMNGTDSYMDIIVQ